MADNIIVSKQDANQVLRLAYDDDAKALRVVGGTSGGDTTVVQPDGSQLHVTVDASALPTGAATEAKQDNQITVLENIESALADQATAAKQDTQIGALNNIQTTSSETSFNTLVANSTLSNILSKTGSSLVTAIFDEQVINYVGATSDIDSVVYKNGGVTVATVQLSYDGQGRLTGVVRS